MLDEFDENDRVGRLPGELELEEELEMVVEEVKVAILNNGLSNSWRNGGEESLVCLCPGCTAPLEIPLCLAL